MTATFEGANYELRLVAPDTVELVQGGRGVGCFTRADSESGERGRLDDDARDALGRNARALCAVARAWFAEHVAAAIASSPSLQDPDGHRKGDRQRGGARLRDSRTRASTTTILLVEPDASFRAFVALVLRRRGYSVE